MAARITGGILHRGPMQQTAAPTGGGGNGQDTMPINPPNSGAWSHYNGPGGGPPGGSALRAQSHGAPSSGSWQPEIRGGVRELREKHHRRKESDRIFVRDPPTVGTKEPWLISLKTNVVIASGCTGDDVVPAWLEEACDTTRSWDKFLASGDDFMTLDVKLATALTAFFKGDTKNVNETSQIMFLLIDEQMNATGRVARGRHVLNASWHDLTSGIYVTTLVTWQTLASVELSGNKLSDFSNRWYKVLKEIRVGPDPNSLIEMLTKQMKKSDVVGKGYGVFR